MNQLPYELPSELERAIVTFADYYNYHRYHMALGDVTPADVLYGRREQILEPWSTERRCEHKQLIVAETTTMASESLPTPPDHAKVFGLKSVPFR